MGFGGKLRVAVVTLSFGAPIVWLSPGCGARSDIVEYEDFIDADIDAATGDGSDEADAPDAQPDGPLPDVVDDVPIDVPADVPIDVPDDVPADVPLDVPEDVPADVPIDVPIDVPADVPIDVPIDVPADVPIDVPIDVPADVPIDVPADVPIDVVFDGPCTDFDGDGYTTCENDCNDLNSGVNPGAFDFTNGIDDDCDGVSDNPFVSCGAGLAYTSQDPFDYASAIELCQTTTAAATGAAKTWGLINAELLLADGTGVPASQSHAIITSFGSVLMPRKNENFVFFSSGHAGTPGQAYYQPFQTPQGGSDMGTFAVVPPGFPTNKTGCAVPSAIAFDSVNLRLTIRTPTNAQSFGFDHSFFSAEYPEFACSFYNDMWVALLDTGAPGIANNHDIVFDAQGTPGSVNLNFFDRCVAGPTGCFGTPGFNFCSGGKGELAGTGYDGADTPCGPTSSIGGGTGWLTSEAPILPGEIITFELMVWDSSDGIYDSSAIFDNFHWFVGALPNAVTKRAP